MKNLSIKYIYLVNNLFVIIYMCYLSKSLPEIDIRETMLLGIITLLLIDGIYIRTCNIKNSEILNSFCFLLLLTSWYMMFSIGEIQNSIFLFTLMTPLIFYWTLKFLLTFFFQGSGLRFGKTIHTILIVTCVGSVLSLFISKIAFFYFLELQAILYLLVLIMIIINHRNRLFFVVKTEKISLLVSVSITFMWFFLYMCISGNTVDNISNFGLYIPAIFSFLSVHNIIRKKKLKTPLSTIFTKKQMILGVIFIVSMICFICVLLSNDIITTIIFINIFTTSIFLVNLFLEANLKSKKELPIVKRVNYLSALSELKKEEELKNEFADFLHDDILQDILSLRNLLPKIDNPLIYEIVDDTLDSLHSLIRAQMKDYHPIVLKSLTLKENYTGLVESIANTYPNRKIMTTIECEESLFLVAPYDKFVYRMIRELVNNVYKHSSATKIWLTLAQHKNVVKVLIGDNGSGVKKDISDFDKNKHKGITSIKELVEKMNGTFEIVENRVSGFSVVICFLMEGEDSYKYFIS